MSSSEGGDGPGTDSPARAVRLVTASTDLFDARGDRGADAGGSRRLYRGVVPDGEGSNVDRWTGLAFFIWTTVFALFNTSIFWCLMADVFRSEQAKRVFGFIGVGGTLGSIIGSAATAALAPRIGAVNLPFRFRCPPEITLITLQPGA